MVLHQIVSYFQSSIISIQVVTVWQYWARRRRLAVKVCLYGHEEAVTCLAASPAYNLVVSGSRDGQAIVWDVERGSFIRQLLPPHCYGPPPPVSALAIDDLTVSFVLYCCMI